MQDRNTGVKFGLQLLNGVLKLKQSGIVNLLVELDGIVDLAPGEYGLGQRKGELVVHVLLAFVDGDVVVPYSVGRCVHIVAQIHPDGVYGVGYVASRDCQVNGRSIAGLGIADIQQGLGNLFPGLADIGVVAQHRTLEISDSQCKNRHDENYG